MHTNTKSFKVYCRPLTQKKLDILTKMVTEYSKVYNFASKYIPSVDDKYWNTTNPSKLYTIWIKSDVLKLDMIQSSDAFNAIKDACRNYSVSHTRNSMYIPNIIKFESGRYKIIRYKNNYGIQIGSDKEGIYLPLKTGGYIKLIKRLDEMILLKEQKKTRIKELSVRRKEGGTQRAKRQKTNLGTLIYNLRDNSVSIATYSIASEFKKKEEIKTIIGVDLGKNNTAVFTAISIEDISEVSKLCNKLYNEGHKDICLKDIPHKILKVNVLKGFKTKHKVNQIKIMEDKRRKVGKEVGHKRKNITDYTNHYVSSEITKFASMYPNPVVIFEKNLANLRNPTWSPSDVKAKTEYKLTNKGIWIYEVYAAYTSQICSHCGAKGVRDSIYFKCNNCGLGVGSNPTSTVGQYNADVNASINIALRGLYILTRKGKTIVEYKDGIVSEPNVQPNDTTQETRPQVINEVVDGTSNIAINDIASCKDMNPVDTNVSISLDINQTTKCSSLQVKDIKEQSMVEIPPRDGVSENGFSCYYKQNYTFVARTELAEKINIGGTVSKR